MAVTLCRRPSEEGKSRFYLEYYPPVLSTRDGRTVYEEDLPSFVYDPASDVRQMRFNAESQDRAEKLRQSREKEIRRGEIKTLGISIDFISFYQCTMLAKSDAYRPGTLMLMQFCGKSLPFDDVNLDFAERYRNWLLTDPTCRGGNPLKAVTASNYFAQFKYVLAKAYEKGYMKENLDAKLHKIEKGGKNRRMISDDELKTLLASPPDDRDLWQLAIFVLLSGMRITEIINLRWEDIRCDDNRYYVMKSSGHRYQISQEAHDSLGTPGCDGYVFKRLKRGEWSHLMTEWLRSVGITRSLGIDGLRRRLPTLDPYLPPAP